MTPLFEAGLEYETDMAPVVAAAGHDGDYIGSGTATLTGRVHGTQRWSMFAADCAYLLVQAGVDPGSGKHLCRIQPGGIIQTYDGAQIRLEATGYGLRGSDKTRPQLWHMTAALQFATSDARYGWLNTTPGLWEGIFDEQARRATYRAYAGVEPSSIARGADLDKVEPDRRRYSAGRS